MKPPDQASFDRWLEQLRGFNENDFQQAMKAARTARTLLTRSPSLRKPPNIRAPHLPQLPGETREAWKRRQKESR